MEKLMMKLFSKNENESNNEDKPIEKSKTEFIS